MFTVSANVQLPQGPSTRNEIMRNRLVQFSFPPGEEFVTIYARNAEQSTAAFLGVASGTPAESATPPNVLQTESDGDENDVVFIRQYQRGPDNSQTKNKLRRNPFRKARNAKRGFHLQHEHLLEEDFGILDQIDEENMLICKNEQHEVKEPLKTWPINAYERPEYNPSTNQAEPLDCAMKNTGTILKKPKLTVTRKAKAKPKKKYQARKRPASKQPIEMVPAKELQPVVEETLQMIRELSAGSFGSKFGLELLNNQTMLLAIIKGVENDGSQRSDSPLGGPSNSDGCKKRK